MFDTVHDWQQLALMGGESNKVFSTVDETYNSIAFRSVVSHFDNQFKLLALKKDMEIQPIALSCEFFSVTNSFLLSVSYHLEQKAFSTLYRNSFNFTILIFSIMYYCNRCLVWSLPTESSFFKRVYQNKIVFEIKSYTNYYNNS